MKTIQTLFFLAFMAMGTMSIAQSGTGEIKGFVFGLEENQPLYNATVYVTYGEEMIGGTTDFDGKFSLKPLQPGEYMLNVSYLGKQTQQISLLVKSGQIALRDTVFLGISEDILTPPITIMTYRDPLINPFEVSKPTMRAEELKNIPSLRNPTKLLIQLGEGSFSNGGGEDGQVYFRGSRTGSVVTYLDGMKIYGTVPSFPAAAISSFAVYTGGLPAKFGDTSGGVIEIETKSYFELYNERMAQLAKQNQ